MRVKAYFIVLLSVLLLFPVFTCKTYAAVTSVSNVDVILQDYVVDRPVNYFVRFITSQTLQGGRDVVTVVFPAGIDVSENINKDNVAINGFNVDSIDFSDGTLQVLVPSGRTIQAGQSVEVGIASAAIRNPRTAGSYYVTVYTSLDTRAVNSTYFTITDYEYSDGVSKPTVKLTVTQDSNSDTGYAYEIVFKTSVNGRLVGPTDKIFLEFASGSGMPTSLDGQYIAINGVRLTNQVIPVSGRTITLPMPANMSIAAKEQIKVNVFKEADVVRPTAAYNTMRVWTSVETRPIISFDYEIVTTTATENQTVNFKVTPTPDGAGVQAGYILQIAAGLLTDSNTGESASGFILAFPTGTVLPDTINKEHIKVNGIPASGIIGSPLQKEIIFTLPVALSLQSALNIQINQAAGIKNPVSPADYKLDARPITSPKSWSSSFFTIRTTSTVQNPPVVVNPPASAGTTTTTNQIQLRINSRQATIDGVSNTLDTTPVIVNDVTLVPLRFISTALGASVDYVEAGKYATVEDATRKLVLWVDSKTAKVNNTFQMMTQAATIVNDRLMVPLRFISESFGLTVNWNGDTQTVTLLRGQTTADPDTVTAEVVTVPEDQYPVGYKAYIKTGNNYCNIRLGPGLNYSDIGDVFPGEAMTVLSEQEGWYRIKTSAGVEAWIAGWMVDIPRN